MLKRQFLNDDIMITLKPTGTDVAVIIDNDLTTILEDKTVGEAIKWLDSNIKFKMEDLNVVSSLS